MRPHDESPLVRPLTRRRFFALVAATGAGAALAACTPAAPSAVTQPTAPATSPTTAPQTTGPRTGGTLVWPLWGVPKDWYTIAANTTWHPDWFTHSALVGRNAAGALEPWLATSWEVSPDGKTYTFILNKNVQWHDGEPFTAEDVLFTFNLVADPDVASWRKGELSVVVGWDEVQAGGADTISGLTMVDDFTVQFQLKDPSATFVNGLAGKYIYPQHILGDVAVADLPTHAYWREQRIGTGPFKFDRLVPDEVAELVRFDGYFGQKAYLDKIAIPARIAELAVENQEVLFTETTPDQVEHFQQFDFLDVIAKPSFRLNFMPLNMTKPYLQDKRVRQAMLYALDRKLVLDELWAGSGSILNTWMPDTSWHPADLTAYEYDPDKAKALLAEAGWDSTIELNFVTYYTSPFSQNEHAFYIDAWDKVGIKVTYRPVDVPTFIKEYYEDSSFDVAYAAGIYHDPDDIYNGLVSDRLYPTGSNGTHYNNPQFDDLMKQGRVTVDPAARQEIYAEAQKIFNDELPWLPLFEPAYFNPINKKLHGFGDTYSNANGPNQKAETWWISE